MACSVSSQSGSCCIPRWGLSIQLPVSLLLIKFSETMGNILAFIKQLRDGGLENIDEKYHIFLDFENENLDFNDLREEEKALAEKIEEKLKSSAELLRFLQDYGGGGRKFIVEASANVSDLELQNKAWENVVPMIANLQKLKDMTESLNQEVKKWLLL